MPTRAPFSLLQPKDLELLVFGHVNLDHFLAVRSLPTPDRTVPISEQRTELGGTATNLARAASAWGVRTGILSRIGSDFPPEYLRLLRREHIDLRGLVRVPRVRSSCCYIVEDGHGGQMTLIHQGPMGSGSGARVPIGPLSTSGWLHLSTGDPAYQLRVLEAARSMGVKVSVDPSQEIHYRWSSAPFRSLLAGAEILFGNTSEIDHAMELMRVRSPRDLLEFVPLVVQTMGRRGAAAYSRAGTESVPAVAPRKLRQVTGAGDAFRGGFYAGWFAGQGLRQCLIAATRSAARWMGSGSVATLRKPHSSGG